MRAPTLHPRPVLLLAVTLALASCGDHKTPYAASSPDETIDAAQQMILDGNADQLTDLIYAENDQFRSFFNQIGSMLGSLQDLGDAVESRFPTELAAFRAEAEAAAAEGKTNPILARLVSAGRGSGGNRSFGVSQINREGLTLDTGAGSTPAPSNPFSGRQSESTRLVVNGIIKQLLADPYRWLEDGRDKIDHVYITDDTVSLTWDGKPILPPFGLTLIERDGRWFLVPPTSYPGVSMALPRNDDEWFVWGSMVKTLERVVIDLTRDVRNGSIRNMTDLADSAAEKVAIPAMLVFFAYGNLMEERKAEAKRLQAAKDAAEQPAAQPTDQPDEQAPEGDGNDADPEPEPDPIPDPEP